MALTQFPENPASSCQGLSKCTSQPSALGREGGEAGEGEKKAFAKLA